MTSAHIPVRTCVATRRTAPQNTLLRVVADPHQPVGSDITVLVPDPLRRLPGRGAWITPDEAACHTAVVRRAFQRALRLSTPVDASAVLEFVQRRGADGVK